MPNTAPICSVDLETLDRDPYPIFAQIRASGPVAWMERLSIYYVVGYNEVRQILTDDVHFSTGTDHSLLQDTFGVHMLTQNGEAHVRERGAFRGAFSPAAIKSTMSEKVVQIVDRLIEGFAPQHRIDLRPTLAARLPVLAILDLFGIDASHEPSLRIWYDDFEKALANFSWNEGVRSRARIAVVAFHTLLHAQIDRVRKCPGDDLLSRVVQDASDTQLTDGEIIRNASIIFFGGISTVEALLLNTLYACAVHNVDLANGDAKFVSAAIEEVMRWQSPVQSATRHVLQATEVAGVMFKPGDTVNCMLGAANRDPTIFTAPDVFDPRRKDASRHLGFATGAHFCLGSHLARLEVQTALTRLFTQLPGIEVLDPSKLVVRGYEFRQPKELWVRTHLLKDQ
jgi:cytochrome P450